MLHTPDFLRGVWKLKIWRPKDSGYPFVDNNDDNNNNDDDDDNKNTIYRGYHQLTLS